MSRRRIGRAVLVADDQVGIVVDAQQLVVGVDRVAAGRAVEAALGAVGVGGADRALHIGQGDAVAGHGLGVGLDADGRALAAADSDQAHAGDLADLLGQAGVDQVLHLGQRQGVGRHRQGQDRRVGRIDLGVDRRGGQVGRQQAVGPVDGGLHLLLGDVEASRPD
jgi:hypothetical protein